MAARDELWEPEELEPTELSTDSFGNFLEVGTDKLAVKYVGQGHHENDVGAIQSNNPVPIRRLLYYFEVSIEDAGRNQRIGVGFADRSFKLSRCPGWETNSYGYHGHDGSKYNGSSRGEIYGPKFTTGDIVGAGIHLEEQTVFFTKNGELLGTAFPLDEGTGQALYPTVGLHSMNAKVVVNFGAKPFKFNLAGMIEMERAKLANDISSISMPWSYWHLLVREYLLHHGYSATVKALDKESNPSDAMELASCEAPPRAENGKNSRKMKEKGAPNGVGANRSMSNGETSADTGQPEHKGGCSLSSASGASKLAQMRSGLALDQRGRVRQLLLEGKIDQAIEFLDHEFPGVLTNEDGSSSSTMAFLQCQKFVELVRVGELDNALEYARKMLVHLRDRASEQEHLQEIIALLAYENIEQSPLAPLLSVAQRYGRSGT
mmetsp:Transcript_11992/g.43791  ORF Transcript_11992/g.43791 Transcript_11992/m.43791 type:complete len:433 (+) Transcript_11992:318-1616(+)